LPPLVYGAGRATGFRSCANRPAETSKRARKDLDIGVLLFKQYNLWRYSATRN